MNDRTGDISATDLRTAAVLDYRAIIGFFHWKQAFVTYVTRGVPLCTGVVACVTRGAMVRSGQLLLGYQLYLEK